MADVASEATSAKPGLARGGEPPMRGPDWNGRAALPPGVLRRSTADAQRPGRRKSDVERRNGRTRAGGRVAAEPRAQADALTGERTVR